ncbi:ABC-2 type transport system permease protein [Leifsonia sp. EB41]|uniref:ABC transporter permease n=1 Tax=Leifsonia sp. EB41 TaxID=3156260 RepID=UPI0035111F1D
MSSSEAVPVGEVAATTTAPAVASLGARRARPSAGWALLGSELSVMFRRWRTWAMLGALAAVPILIAVAVRLRGGGRGPAFLEQITSNGLFVAFTALVVCVPLFLPLTIGVVAGDTIAGEASHGTLRYLVIAPAGRLRLLAVKFAGCAVFCVAAALVVALAGALIGALLFPIGPVTLLSGAVVSLGEAAVRMLLIALYIVVSLLGMCAIGLFLSTLTDVPVGAMAATAVLAVVSQVLDQLPQLDAIHPWLFSHYWLGFADFLRAPLVWDSFVSNLWLQAGYVAVFGALAIGRFLTKDILS